MITSDPVLFTLIAVFALQAMVLSGLIVLKRPRKLAHVFLALLVFFYALMAINIVVVNVLKDRGLMEVFRYIQLELLFGIGPALYFYTRCVTNPDFKFKKQHWWHFLPLVLEFMYYRTSLYRNGSDGLYEPTMPASSYLYLAEQWLGVISILTYSMISLWLLYKYQNVLKQLYSRISNRSLKWLQTPIIIFAGFQIFWNIIREVDRFVFESSLREYYFLPTFVGLAVVCYWIGLKGYMKKDKDTAELNLILPNEDKPELENDPIFKEKLERLMKTKQPYLNPDLSLSKLAALMDMNPRQLSYKINQNYERNFYDFVNNYRVEAVKQRLQSKERDQLSLLGHALDCGFNSKSTFNHVFKKTTQLTPSQYLRKTRKASE